MNLIITASSAVGGVIWVLFGGLLSGSVAAYRLGRIVYAGELDPDYYNLGVLRLRESPQVGRKVPAAENAACAATSPISG